MSRRRSEDLKDTLSYLGGWGLIIHQVAFVPSPDFNLYALVMGGLLVGVPGLRQLLPALVQLIASIRGIASGPSPSPPAASPPSLPPSPSSSGADR